MTLKSNVVMFAIALLSIAAIGCRPQSPMPDVTSRSDAAAPAPTSAPVATNASVAQASTEISTPSPGAGGMDKTCEGTTFRITRTPGAGDDADATMLQKLGPASAGVEIPKPAEMAEYTAVGLGCAIAASDKKPYFVVQYGELPFGCEFCEWFYLYDASGKQLTRSDPVLLTDESMPEGQRQSANTREYESMIEKLGIAQPEVAYIK